MGIATGVWVTYDLESGLPQEGRWLAGERDGVWTEYDSDGKPVRERIYQRGRLSYQREL